MPVGRTSLGSPVRLGIGLNSGVARVGNTGSLQKFKYGPLGDAVNVASRTQGATKYLGADCLVTGSTLRELPKSAAARRLARVRAVNIEQAIDLYEIVATAPADWDDRCRRYQEALGRWSTRTPIGQYSSRRSWPRIFRMTLLHGR